MNTISRLPFLLIILLQINCDQSTKSDAIENEKISKSLDLYLPGDLEATLWAESPMFYNPTNIDVDYRGRIWVTEAVDYRNYNNDSAKNFYHPQGDRIMILEDTDGDGKADKSKVFVQDKDLVAPLGIAVIGNKIIVSCSPNLLIYTDENGDDIPDKKEKFLTGFGGKDHDHSLHAVYAGPDGNWYFNTGNAGPHIVTDKAGWTLRAGSIYTGGSPYNTENQGRLKSDDGEIWVGGLALRINPDGTGLKVMAHNFRNSYEVIPDSYGNLWQNDNDDQVVTCRTTWLMEGGNAGYFSTDGTRTWQGDQRPGQEMFQAHWHQDDPGVMPAGDCSGAGAPAGITINESDALGEKYMGMLLSADAGRNVIFGYHPLPMLSGFDLGKRQNFISSLAGDNADYVWNDTSQNKLKEKWFRPSDITIGTDGALYIADWYDPVVGGHQMEDSLGYGRIYRIAPKNKKLVVPKIDLATSEGQLLAFKSPAINVRNIGFELLKSSGNKGTDLVKPLLMDGNPYIKARAIWLLSQSGEEGATAAGKFLSDPDPQFRATAYRALRQTVKDILPYAKKMAADESPFVRREVAISLRDIPFKKTKPILLELIKKYDGNDRWYLENLGAALEGHEEEIYPDIVTIFGKNIKPENWNSQMADLTWRLHPAAAINDLMTRANHSSLTRKERETAITALAFINNKKAATSMVSLSQNQLQDIAEMAAYWLSFRQSNNWYSLLDWSKINVNTGYERRLAQMKIKKQIILDERQSANERKWRVQEMAADSIGGQMLIGLASEKKLPEKLIPFIREKIFLNPDATIRMQAGNYFARPGTEKRYSITEISKFSGDAVTGKKLFKSRCSVCHKAGDDGNNIGPDLSSVAKKFGNQDLLDAIINPGAAIVFGYEAWLINTKDGESLYGLLLSENNKAIVIKDIAGNKHTIDVKKISTKQKQDKSLMPDPDALGLSEKDLADIVSYLKKL